jgi:hypothetical protein
MHRSAIDRFLSKISPEPNSGCWLWTGAYHRQGYGQFAIATKQVILAHRASWFFCTGVMPTPDQKVCHKCDVPECVNHDHLWLGTQRDNVLDAFAKKRMVRKGLFGSANPMALVNAETVLAIRKEHGIRTAKLVADDFGVSASTVYAIWRRDNWAWL